eukprot:13246525-Ditylum_brightwellii.AAC.2
MRTLSCRKVTVHPLSQRTATDIKACDMSPGMICPFCALAARVKDYSVVTGGVVQWFSLL